ncbi:MAG: efflux RND transporter permease subunit [Rhodospirillales bacterium]|nr:efflux RND transporter permease subunit [Rhodospirillales bacterium]MBO6786090.1 efflux RND transporter permease subunit [Rhodospirillales bacterium]
MNALIEAAVSHSRTVLGGLVLILITGAVAFNDIPKEADPDVNIPIIYVSMSHEGISPEDAERLLIRPMEQELRSLEGVKEMRSKAYEGGANVTLEFDAGFDADEALSDVREKVDLAKPELPSESDEPEVHEVNFSLFPVLVVTLSGNVPERTLQRLARDLRDEIEGISMVLKAEIAGDREELVEVLIDPVAVESYGLSPTETVASVSSSNLLVAAGAQDTGQGRFAVKVPGLFETVEDIASMPVKVDGDSAIVLGDIAEIRRGFKDPTTFARVDGHPAVALEVSKRTGQNIIETVEAVRRVVEAERQSWTDTMRDSISVEYLQDKSDDIRLMLTDLQNNVLSAILLVMVIVVAALGLRTAGLVGIAIPGSFLTAILVLYSVGMTVNIVVLFSLILAVGMLVDGAIVVTEYADRKMTEGESKRVAYTLAAKRMAWPIIASTATTLAAFLPLVFWPGVVGEFMKFLPITLLMTLSASLAMALIFVPTLGAQIGKPGGAVDPDLMRELAGSSTFRTDHLSGITGAYVRILDAALRHPVKILLAAVVLLVGVQVVYGKFGKGVEFFPEVEPELAKLQVRARGNLSVWEQYDLMKVVESRILDVHGIRDIYTRVGKNEQSEDAEDIIGEMTLEFEEWDQRRKASVILAEVNEKTRDIAGIFVDRRTQEAGPPVGKDVQVELSSRNVELLEPAIAKLRAYIENDGEFENIEDSRPLPGIEFEINVDRAQAAKYDANIEIVGRAIQLTTNGLKLGEYRPDDSDDEIDVRARYPERFRTLDELQQIRIATRDNQSVPIANFVDVKAKQKTGTLNRTDTRRVMSVKADVIEGVLVDNKVKQVEKWIAEAGLDPRITVRFKGEDEEQKKAQAFLVKAFGIALFLMALILVTQFNSFYSAFLILSAVVMSTIGVFIGLLLIGQPFGVVMSGIGVIALAGIVVNNNIVLIDTFDRLKEESGSVRDAILKTGAQRLRPVLLTTVTTILGLMPMVLRVNIDFVNRSVNFGAPSTQWWTQLSTAIVFGLAFATVLTLIVTPSALMLRGNVAAWRARRRERKQAQLA